MYPHRPSRNSTWTRALPLAGVRRRPARRRGAITVEAIFVIFILLLTTLAAFQFGLALTIRQATSHASTVAAREAAKGADADELVGVVNAVLQTHGIEIGPKAGLVLEVGMLPPETRGMPDCSPPATPSLSSDDVRVTVCVSLDQIPFINPLSGIGVTLTDKSFQESSLLRQELP